MGDESFGSSTITVVGSPPTTTRRASERAISIISVSASEGARDQGRPTWQREKAAVDCVFRRNMGLFPFATRFARASQLAFVASLPANDLTRRLDRTCPFLRARLRELAAAGLSRAREIISKLARNSSRSETPSRVRQLFPPAR
ncbi:hypothetical protein PUN28_000193 [Cardiocondyla obscurior]|uniref:Uncharacterized protein n=1 Tax=Cardiocondyla obscurior TaxID=286306 RepID=A0AAW2GYG3_9HYME